MELGVMTQFSTGYIVYDGTTYGADTALSLGGGEASGSNIFGRAGGLGSGLITGSASGFVYRYTAESTFGSGTATAIFNSAGSGIFLARLGAVSSRPDTVGVIIDNLNLASNCIYLY
jgi:hypothetical protein